MFCFVGSLANFPRREAALGQGHCQCRRVPPGVLPPVGVPHYHPARPGQFPTFQLSSFLLCISPQGIGNRDLKCKLQEQNKRVTLNCSDGNIVCRLCVPRYVNPPTTFVEILPQLVESLHRPPNTTVALLSNLAHIGQG